MEYSAKPDGIYVNGARANIRGTNWFGMEGDNALHGLWAVSLESILDTLAKEGFNLIRIPLNLEFMENPNGTQPATINYAVNPQLLGKSAGDIMDIILTEMAKRGMLALPDVHRTKKTDGIDPWPINENRSVDRLTKAWINFLDRYSKHKCIVGCDLCNEPHHQDCTWDKWATWAEQVGNGILAKHPDKLIFVAGVFARSDDNPLKHMGAYWGGVLDGVRKRPVVLNVANRLVYTPHVYGPAVFEMDYMKTPEFPGNLPKIWDNQWGHVAKEGLGCCFIGELGGTCEGKDAVWHEAITKYVESVPALQDNFAMWCVNSNGSDTLGVFKKDWVGVEETILPFYRRMCPNPTKFVFTQSVPQKPEPTPVKPVVAPKPPGAPGVKLTVIKRESWKQGNDVMTKIELEVHNGTKATITPTVHASKCVPINTWSCSPNPPLAQGTHVLSLPVWLMGVEPGKSWSCGGIFSSKPGTEPVFKLG